MYTYLSLIAFLYYCFRKKDFKYLALTLWVMVPVIFFTMVATKMKGYILFIGPAMFLITAWSIRFLHLNLRKFKYQKFVKLLIALLLILPVRYSIERIKPFSPRFQAPEWTLDLKELAYTTKDANAVVFNVEHPVKAMFYGDLVAYHYLPTAEQIETLKQQGYQVYLYKLDASEREQFLDTEAVIFIE